MSRAFLDDLLDELALRLRHTFGNQLHYLGTTTTAQELEADGDVDVLIVLSQLSDAHIRLVWSVVSSVRHSWNVFVDCRVRTIEDVGKQSILEQFLLKRFLRDCVGSNPFGKTRIATVELRNECRQRIIKQEDRILGLLPNAIADVRHLHGIGSATFEALRAFLVLIGKPQTSKKIACDILTQMLPAFDDIQDIYDGHRNPNAVSDVSSYVATSLGIVKHLSYRAECLKCDGSVLLVNAPSSLLPHPIDDSFGYDANMPLGLLCLGAHLRNLNLPVNLLDAYALNLTATGTVDAIVRDFGLPKVVGFNPSSPNIHVVHAVAKYLKRISDDVRIVLGGAHATLATKHTLSCNYVDYAVVGEGEIPFGKLAYSLLNNDSTETISGVYTRDVNGETVGHPQDTFLPLNELSAPPFDMLPLNERYFAKRKRGYLHTSRGCSFNCAYCSVHKFWGRQVREIPMDVVLNHVRSIQRDFGVEEVQIVDDNFSHKKGKRIEAFCIGLAERQIKLRWKCQVRADQLSADMIALMGRSGCFEVDIGVESGNKRVQTEIKKNLDLDKTRVAVENLGKSGIVCKAFFILGFPSETWNELQDSINLAIGLKKAGLLDVAFFPAMPFPGTSLADYAHKNLGVQITQGAVMDDQHRFMGSYALRRLRKYAAMPEASLNKLFTPRELRLLCGFAYTCFEKSESVDGLEQAFRRFATEQEAMSYGS